MLAVCLLILTIISETLDMNAFKDDVYGQVAARDADIKQDKLEELMTEFLLTMPSSISAEQGTPQWKAARRMRLTASNYGQICKMRSKTSPKNTIQNLLYPSFTGNAATAYGLREEPETEKMFVDWLKINGCDEISVSHPGLVLLPDENVFGASPDGIFCCQPSKASIPSSFVVEYQNQKKLADAGLTVDDAIRTKVKDFPLGLDENGNYALKTSHSFYYQVQGVMAATELPNAAFVIRGAKLSMAVIRITFDKHFFLTHILPKLRRFYYQAILPELAYPLMSISGARPYNVEWNYM
jgi:hypothetical protein